MMRSLLVRGLAAGLIAGLFALVFAYTVGEPPVRSAIAVEGSGAAHEHAGETPPAAATAEDEGEGEGEGEEIVSRDTQSTLGLATGVLSYGVAIGGLFALVFSIAIGRIGPIGARGTAALLGLIGWVSVFLVPFLKYPANPPAVGDGDTIGRRASLFLTMIIVSVAVAWLAVHVRGRLAEGLGGWNATVAAGAAYVVVMLLVAWSLPQIQEVPADFPPTLLWQFRTASVGTQVVLWSVLAVSFGLLARKVVEPAAATPPVAERVPVG